MEAMWWSFSHFISVEVVAISAISLRLSEQQIPLISNMENPAL